MCIHCNNKLLAATDKLCLLLKSSEKEQIAYRLEAALSNVSGTTQDALNTAMDVVCIVLKLEKKAADTRVRKVSDGQKMDHEQKMVFLLLNYLQLAVSALFGDACVDAVEHKKLVVALMRISTVEASCAAALAATIQYYRAEGLGELPAILQGATFQEFCLEAAIPAERGGGRSWRDAQYARWKRDNLMKLYNGDDNGPNVAFAGCRQCWTCLAPTLEQKCGGCRLRCSGCCTAVYCSKKCQKSDWKAHHKALCEIVASARVAERDGTGYGQFDVWATSVYNKWKRRDENWKPFTAGLTRSPIAIFVDALQARDPVPSFLVAPSELETLSIGDADCRVCDVDEVD